MIHDTVTAAHGDGAGATQQFIRDFVLSRFGNPVLNPLDDAASVPWTAGAVTVSTDSFVVDPLLFPGGDIGGLAVSGTINDLTASGARTCYLTLSLVMAEGLSFETLATILDSAAAAARAAGALVVAGDTKVVPRGSVELVINTTALGIQVAASARRGPAFVSPGDAVMVTGTVGDHAIAVLSAREGLGFEQRVSSDCAALDDLILPLLADGLPIRCLRDPTRGGLLGAVIDIAEASGCEIRLDTARVPVDRHVAMACEMLGLDPLQLVNEGKMVLVVDPSSADLVLARLRAHPRGQRSEVVGAVHAARSAQVVLDEPTGARIAVRPWAAGVPRLC
jgi:hydrogenase expression/formation protein HypE